MCPQTPLGPEYKNVALTLAPQVCYPIITLTLHMPLFFFLISHVKGLIIFLGILELTDERIFFQSRISLKAVPFRKA